MKASKWHAIDRYGGKDTYALYKKNKFYDKVTMQNLKLAKI